LYIDIFEKASNMTHLNAEQNLRSTTYIDCTDFTNFITDMHNKWSNARALGANIPDEDFKNIIINVLPDFWDPVVVALYDPSITSSEAISHLQTWYTRINRNWLTSTNQNTTALQTFVSKQRQRSQLICVNPNYGRREHTIENCYWPRGGKEEQFPLGFGKRGGSRGIAINTRQGHFTQRPTANTVELKGGEDANTFALMSMTDTTIQVLPSLPPPNITNPNITSIASCDNDTKGVCDKLGVRVGSRPVTDPIIFNTDAENTIESLTFLDSGVSNHCVADKSLFTTYSPLEEPVTGLSARKGSTFI